MHYKLFRVITLSARDITLKSDKDGKIAIAVHFNKKNRVFFKAGRRKLICVKFN